MVSRLCSLMHLSQHWLYCTLCYVISTKVTSTKQSEFVISATDVFTPKTWPVQCIKPACLQFVSDVLITMAEFCCDSWKLYCRQMGSVETRISTHYKKSGLPQTLLYENMKCIDCGSYMYLTSLRTCEILWEPAGCILYNCGIDHYHYMTMS